LEGILNYVMGDLHGVIPLVMVYT